MIGVFEYFWIVFKIGFRVVVKHHQKRSAIALIFFNYFQILGNHKLFTFFKSAAFTPKTLSSIHHFKFLEVIAVFRIQSYSITNQKGSAILTKISNSGLRIEWKTFLAFTILCSIHHFRFLEVIAVFKYFWTFFKIRFRVVAKHYEKESKTILQKSFLNLQHSPP